ncbi:MAG: DUF58 domain-containing protein [Gaiellaceae bacterium]
MTQRGRFALLLGCATYLGAWAFGSKPLYPVALGLFAAVLLAWLWTRLAGRPSALRRRLPQLDRFAGDDVQVRVALERHKRLVPATFVVRERIGKLGVRETTVPPRGVASYVLEGLPRGRYAFEECAVAVEDPLGLARLEEPVEAPGALLVYPRLVELDGLFSDAGALALNGRRLLLRRPSGFDLHSVREYERGESLRKVHWPSTAKRQQLMVKELEDAPRDEVAVVLDVDPTGVVGDSFETQVRAAGSILMAHGRRGRRAVLVLNSPRKEQERIHPGDLEGRQALELLAAVEPEPGPPLHALLGEDGPAGRGLELAVVTATLSPRLVMRLVERTAGRRSISLVLVDAASFGQRGTRSVYPGLLALQAAGVTVAVVSAGDDLAAVLSAPAVDAARG